MKKEFIKIDDNRIKTNTIKRYKPVGERKICIHYSASRSNPQIESFILGSSDVRDNLIEELDLMFGM